MPFVVKWIPQDAGAIAADPHWFDHLPDALDHACAALRERPTDIWVEDEVGARIANQHRIIAHCKERNLLISAPPVE
jgi:hypothetical protein